MILFIDRPLIERQKIKALFYREVLDMKFILNGCDISFIAEAPEDITLRQLLTQCDKIYPNWCACGICSCERAEFGNNLDADIIIGYESIKKANEGVPCQIRELIKK